MKPLLLFIGAVMALVAVAFLSGEKTPSNPASEAQADTSRIDSPSQSAVTPDAPARTVVTPAPVIIEPIRTAPEVPDGWLKPSHALERTLQKQSRETAATIKPRDAIDRVNQAGDTPLLAAISAGDVEQALRLINKAANPFYRNAAGESSIDLAHRLNQHTVVNALILSAINESRWEDRTIVSLLSGDAADVRFTDGASPLHRAVATGNERAMVTMLRLPSRTTPGYRPRVDLYAYNRQGEQAVDIAARSNRYGALRILQEAMRYASPRYAVSRATFTTAINNGEPADCRKTAFEDENELIFFAEITGLTGKQVRHDWYFNRQLAEQQAFDLTETRSVTTSRRTFSAADIGHWQVRVVSSTDELLHSAMLNYQALTNYNSTHRDNFHAPCDLGGQALYALTKSQAPMAQVEELFSRGVTLRPRTNRGSDLYYLAVQQGNLPLTRWMLDHGFDIDGYLNHDETALMVAAATGNIDMVRLLLERGADVNKQNYTDKETVLQTAVYADQAEVAALLLAYGANPDSKDSGHYTALHRVAFRCHFASAAVLLDAGADATLRDKEGKIPAVHAESCNADQQWREQIAPLLGSAAVQPS